MSRKDDSFDQLLKYLNNEKERDQPHIVHNLRTQNNDLNAIFVEFNENQQFCSRRTNGVTLYHDVMSFSPKDSENLTHEMLEEFACRYIEKRAINTLVYAKVHLDRTNPHIHFMISGNLLESPKKLRLSRSRFNRIKLELEQYQLEKYPFLDKSIATRIEREKRGLEVKGKTKSRKKKEQERRKGRKEVICMKLETCLEAFTHEDYLDQLTKAGLKEYLHGNTPGIIDLATGKKHRLKTLGMLEEHKVSVERWISQTVRLQELRNDRERKIRRQLHELGFREQVADILRPDPGERIKELREIRRWKKRVRGRGI